MPRNFEVCTAKAQSWSLRWASGCTVIIVPDNLRNAGRSLANASYYRAVKPVHGALADKLHASFIDATCMWLAFNVYTSCMQVACSIIRQERRSSYLEARSGNRHGLSFLIRQWLRRSANSRSQCELRCWCTMWHSTTPRSPRGYKWAYKHC